VATILFEHHANPDALKGKAIAVLDYGSQGHAQVPNLYDSGHRKKTKQPIEEIGAKLRTVRSGLPKQSGRAQTFAPCPPEVVNAYGNA